MALADWKEKNPESPFPIQIDQFTVHTPFPKIVMWFIANFWRHENSGEEKDFTIEDCVKNPKLFKEYKKKIDETRQDSDFIKFFKEKVRPSLEYNPFIGNAYTASILLGLISTLEISQEGQRIGILSYGSGAGSLVIEGTVKIRKIFKSDLHDQIINGTELPFEKYEEWREETLKKIRE
jgi:3-hydroxy-3-methylglutaryl CoA synthase